jgi:hypothetical protein
MRGRRCFVLLCIAAACVALPAAARPAHRIVAIGDLHGDFENCLEILRQAQVIDVYGHWATGRDTVIQLGDVVDRGPHGHTIIDFLGGLAREAAKAGGEFIQLLGNHEFMNYQGDAKFVAPNQFKAFGGRKQWEAAFATADGFYGKKIRNLRVAVIRNASVFVHAGITPEFAEMTVGGINLHMRTVLAKRDFTDPIILNDGPIWTRKVIYGARAGDCSIVRASLAKLSRQEQRRGRPPVERMVVGHTIQPNGLMQSFCDGALVAIDICMSQYMTPGCGYLGHLELMAPQGNAAAQLASNGARPLMQPWYFYPPVRDARHPWRPVAKAYSPLEVLAGISQGGGGGGKTTGADGDHHAEVSTPRRGAPQPSVVLVLAIICSLAGMAVLSFWQRRGHKKREYPI